MLKAEVKWIEDNRKDIVKHMKVDKLLDHAQFMDKMDLCKAHLDYIQSRLNDEDKNEALLDLLARRSYTQVLQFAHILKETGQELIASFIQCKRNVNLFLVKSSFST